MAANNRPMLIVAVRHGESEGNWAHEMERRGDSSALRMLQERRHETNYRLTDFGRLQLQKTGEWLRREFSRGFDRYFCSDTVRGRESAANLGLPNAEWQPLSLLRERDSREFQSLTVKQREELIAKLAGAALESAYYFHPFGEAPADLIDQRVSVMLERVSGRDLGAVLWVGHGEWLRALNSRLRHWTKDEWQKAYMDDTPRGSILNGAVHIYTRINPECQSEMLPYLGWYKSYCPWRPDHPSNTDWIKINHLTFSNEALKASVECVEQLINPELPDVGSQGEKESQADSIDRGVQDTAIEN